MPEPPAPPPAPDLTTIEARCDRATPPPWYFVPVKADADRRDHVEPALLFSANEDLEICSTSWLEEDGTFTAAARTDVPVLAAYARALAAENARLRAGMEGLRLEHYSPECGYLYCECGAKEHNARLDALLTPS